MSRLFKIGVIVAALMLALPVAPYAAGRGGGHGGGGFGGGGFRGGGGGAHFGGGGPHFGGGGGRFGGAHFGGGRAFSGSRPMMSHSYVRPGGGRNGYYAGRGGSGRYANRSGRAHVAPFNGRANRAAAVRQNRNGNLESRAVRNRLNSRAVAGTMRKPGALHNPHARAHVASAAALAGWHHWHHGDHGGWWRHRHGGYGWVGPLFWPFAFYDVYGYTFWGDGYDPAFWDYGYDDIYAGLFSPYGYDDLTGYLPSRRGGGTSPSPAAAAPATSPAPDSDNQLALMCGEDARNIAGLPIDRIQQAIRPTDAQRAALDDLANASTDAAQKLRAACPTEIALTAPNRLAAMQTRIETMVAAVRAIQPPLDKFYGLLDDEQKARLNAIVGGRRGAASGSAAVATDCGAGSGTALQWPTDQIEKTLNPTDAQRASLTALQDATAKAADMLKASCAPSGDLTPPARLAAVGTRLETLNEAVKTVQAALTDFYGKLTDEQKAQFEAIGPGLGVGLNSNAASDRSGRARTSHRRRGHNVENMIRRMISFGL